MQNSVLHAHHNKFITPSKTHTNTNIILFFKPLDTCINKNSPSRTLAVFYFSKFLFKTNISKVCLHFSMKRMSILIGKANWKPSKKRFKMLRKLKKLTTANLEYMQWKNSQSFQTLNSGNTLVLRLFSIQIQHL